MVDLVLVRFMVGEERFVSRVKALERAKETGKKFEFVDPFWFEACKVSDYK